MKLVLATILMLTFVCGCKQTQDVSQQQSASIKNEVGEMLSAMSDSLRVRGLDGWLSFMYDSPEFSWEFHGQKTSYDSLKANELREKNLWKSIVLVWDSVLVQPMTMDKATLLATYRETVVDSTNKKSILTGSVEANLVRISNSWRIQSGRTFNERMTEVK